MPFMVIGKRYNVVVTHSAVAAGKYENSEFTRQKSVEELIPL